MGAPASRGKSGGTPALSHSGKSPHCPLGEGITFPSGCRAGGGALPRTKGMWSAARELIDGVSWTVPGSLLLLPRSSPALDRLSQRALTFATRSNRPRSFFY